MKTESVQLVVKTQTGVDNFKHPIYSEEIITVTDVLIGMPTTQEIIDTLELTGKRIAFTLGIPKGDNNNWVDTDVIFWGERFRTIGYPQTGIQENIPLKWGKNVMVERYG